MTYVNTVAALISSRMVFDAYGGVDLPAVGIFVGSLLLAYGFAGFSNFFLRRQFVSDAFIALLVTITVGAFLIFQFTSQQQAVGEMAKVDWQMVPAAILILFALWILAALALACSTRFDMIPTLAICSAFFLLGIMSDYLFGRRADPVWRYDLRQEAGNSRWSEQQQALLRQISDRYDQNKNDKLELAERDAIRAEDKSQLAQAGMGGSWWASVLYTVTPNWQLFWLADALAMGKSTFHWGYVAKAFAYMAAYVGAALSLAVVLFEERELS
jgi:hypothetical protein